MFLSWFRKRKLTAIFYQVILGKTSEFNFETVTFFSDIYYNSVLVLCFMLVFTFLAKSEIKQKH